MALLAVEKLASSSTTPIASYDQTKWNLGTLIKQYTGGNPTDKFIGPNKVGLARPVETAAAIPGVFPWACQYSTTVDWVFLADNAAAAATRRIQWYEHDRTTSVYTFKGFVTLTFPPATNHTVRGFRMSRELYTTGTASVSGTAVTGTGTAWSASRLPVGCRIGFGSTDPTAISTWYEISAVGGDTSITLTASAGSIGDGAYVIEDLRAIVSTTNATATNGGLFMAKGLRIENFTIGGTTIAAAVSTDGVRAVYWLADASTVTNTAAGGAAIGARTSWTQQYVYVLDTAAKIYKYNIRAALTLASGKDTTAFQFATGVQAVTGTMSQTNNGRLDTLSHGPGSGVLSLYFVTTTRIYRAAESGITNGSTTWQSDVMTEVPPGSVNTFAASAVLTAVEVSSQIDRLIVTTTSAASQRSYVTQYRTDAGQMDHIFLIDSKQIDQASEDAGATPHPATLVNIMTCWSEAGLVHIARSGTLATTNMMYSLPLGADWAYASTTNQRLISPKYDTPNCDKYFSFFVNEIENLGSSVLGLTPEPYRSYYRTSGISDNSGSWTALDDARDLSGVSGATSIQFMFEFRTIGSFCVPARIIKAAITYNDLNTDTHYRFSATRSDEVNKRFAWRFVTAFGGSVPALRVRLYDDVSGGLLVDDNTTSPTGTFEKSTNDGSSWVAWTNADKGNDTTYLRYTPASLGDNIKVRAILSLN